jgi:hypothetical protein
MVNHRTDHVIGLLFFAADIGDYRALGFGGNEVRRDLIGLPKAPETTDGLIDLLKAIGEADKSSVGAMLPV